MRAGCERSAGPSSGADNAGTPDPSRLDANLGEFADIAKSCHPGGEEQWRTVVHQTAPMWIGYAGLTPNELRGINSPLLLVVGDRGEAVRLEHVVSLYRTLPTAELPVIPHADHGGPI